MRYQITPNLVAGGNIYPSSFVALDPNNDEYAIQAVSGAAVIGVSGSSTRDAPTGSGASPYHAILKDQPTIFGPFSIVEVKVGALAITRGFVKPDASGFAVNCTSIYDVPAAYSFESANAGELVRMMVLAPLQSHASQQVVTVTADTVLTAADSGKIIQVNANDKVITLPAASVGLDFTVLVSPNAIGGSVGTTVAVGAADKLHGNGFTAALGKGAINTQATAADGDFFRVLGNGLDGYTAFGVKGTWARVA